MHGLIFNLATPNMVMFPTHVTNGGYFKDYELNISPAWNDGNIDPLLKAY